MKPITRMLQIVLALVLVWSGTALAKDLNQIKQGMKQRLPAIVALKAKGVVGENNQGYLSFVGGKKENPQLVAQENNDRKIIYSLIAKQQNVAVDLVAKRRAIKLAQQAKPGEYIQKADGAWVKK
ncbi:MAG: YdbL family protein [Desulfobacterales bacterium]|nr:YdbL family protein [Desulfobacterales bacterium]